MYVNVWCVWKRLSTNSLIHVFITWTSLSHSSRTPRNCRTYKQNIHSKFYVNVENSNNASEQSDAEDENPNIEWVSAPFVAKIFRANWEPLNKQISSLTQLLNLWIPDNAEKTTWTASSCANRPHTGTLLGGKTGGTKTAPEGKLNHTCQQLFVNEKQNKLVWDSGWIFRKKTVFKHFQPERISEAQKLWS